jgi:uncharacterized membrane protein
LETFDKSAEKERRSIMPSPEPNTNTENKLAAKKAAVLGRAPQNRLPLAAGLVCVLLAAAGAFWYLSSAESGKPVDTAAAVRIGGDSVSIPVSVFEDGKAHYFEHRHGPITIRYFVIKSADGVLRAAFDACDVCWPAGKGYAQEGDSMVCRNCGQRFASVKVNEVKGGCNPAPLERRVENGMLVIRRADILEGQGYFDFSRKG